MDREHLLWITISSYYYFYLIYCLTVDKRLLRTLEREDFYPVYQLLRSYKDRWFYKGVYRGLFYFTLPVYLFLNRLRYYRARTSDGKRLHKHDFLYRYSVYFTFPLLMTRILVYLAQDDTNEVINTVANLYYTLVYRIPYVQLLFSLLVMYFYILITYYCEKKVCRFYFLSHLLTIVLSLTFIIQTLVGFYFYFLESVPEGLKIFSFYYGTVLAIEKLLAWVIVSLGNYTHHGSRLIRYGFVEQKKLLPSWLVQFFRLFVQRLRNICSALRFRFGLLLAVVMMSMNMPRFLLFLFKRPFFYELRPLFMNLFLYPALFFALPLLFLYIFPTDSTDSPIGSYLLTRTTNRHTIYYTNPSLKIYASSKKMLYRKELFLLENRWVDQHGIHYLQYCSVENGKIYYFTWQPHTNLLELNGENPQVFIRDGTKDYIRNLMKSSITNLEGTGFEKESQIIREGPPPLRKRYRKKLYKAVL